MSERAIEAALKIMQASTCFGKDVCRSAPCACAAALAAAQRVAGEDALNLLKRFNRHSIGMTDFYREVGDVLAKARAEASALALSPGKELELPEGKYVLFTESGAGRPCRIIIQFQDLADMQRAHESLVHLIQRPVSPGKDMDELCAACGEPRREHVTPGGTRYGPTTLCGVFIPREQ